MQEIYIPRDVRQFKTKVVGPLTAQNLKGAVIAGVMGYGAYFITKSYGLSTDISLFILMAAATPGLCIGWVEWQGMKASEAAKRIFLSYISPAKLLYKTDNNYLPKDDTKNTKKSKKSSAVIFYK